MVSDSSNSNADSTRADIPSSAEVGNTEKKKSLAGFLIGTDVKPLVLVGQCVNFFGLGTVVGFLMGAAIVYGVALFRPLPYAKPASSPEFRAVLNTALSPAEAKKVRLHGFVTDGDDRPVKSFFVAVLASQHGPFIRRNGEFSVEVPLSDKYDIALWSDDRQKMQVYSALPFEPDNVGFTFGDLRLLPNTAPVSLGASALLKTKSTDAVMAKSQRLSDRLHVYALSSE